MLARSRITFLSSFLIAVALMSVVLSACGIEHNKFYPNAEDHSHETGFSTPDGRLHTGAANDTLLSQVKTEILQTQPAAGPKTEAESPTPQIGDLPSEAQEMAAKIRSASIKETAKGTILIEVVLTDSGKIRFEFSETKQLVTPQQSSQQSSLSVQETIHYKPVKGKLTTGADSGYDMSLICSAKISSAAPQCLTATAALRRQGSKTARAGIILRHQAIDVLVRSAQPEIINSTLQRLAEHYKNAKTGVLSSFEVAWGPSGFSLNMNDKELCPSGRLVSTNDLDEPLSLGCHSGPDDGSQNLKGLQGNLIGNTARGELFLEITSTGRETPEKIFILVRRKARPKTPAQPLEQPKDVKSSPPSSDSSTSDSPTTGSETDQPEDEQGDDDEPLFLDEVSSPKNPDTPTGPMVKGWLYPVDSNNPISKQWDKDRKRAKIVNAIKEWQTSRPLSTRIHSFMEHFFPNSGLVTKALAQSSVPAEFSIITLTESNFFIIDGYPIESPSSSSAVGPWQFLTSTAKDPRFGLKVLPWVPIKNSKGKIIRQDPNPCDERADLEKSSVAAGKYFRALLNMFPKDPRLAVAAYNWGEGNIQCLGLTTAKCNQRNRNNGVSQDRLNDIRSLGLSFWAIHEYNMAPKKTLDYVVKFISAHLAILESAPTEPTAKIAPWAPSPQCQTK